jgi:2-keto-4-pentenoate hydratase/2-oxohepta-3-ene-1,7-dioic acid hydratase in catechol pathway
VKLGRIEREAIDGPVARLVTVEPERGRVIDLAVAEQLRLLDQGASVDAARRVATALFPGSMAAAIATGDEFLTRAAGAVAAAGNDERAVLSLEDVRWLAAVDPPMARDAMAFEQHAVNSYTRSRGSVPDSYYELPSYYKASSATFIGHEATVPWPAYTREMDYELELGFVIGRGGRDLDPDAAARHLFGVTVYGDFSARDRQRREMQSSLGPAKGKDFGTAIGPWITTVDELDLERMAMIARVNGDEWSRGSSGTIMWSAPELIAYISTAEPLQPGDLIGSGTVGWGCGMETDRSLRPGDVVELEVEGIGVLRNRLGEPSPAGWTPEPKLPRATPASAPEDE